jgi:hypothetical protein
LSVLASPARWPGVIFVHFSGISAAPEASDPTRVPTITVAKHLPVVSILVFISISVPLFVATGRTAGDNYSKSYEYHSSRAVDQPSMKNSEERGTCSSPPSQELLDPMRWPLQRSEMPP